MNNKIDSNASKTNTPRPEKQWDIAHGDYNSTAQADRDHSLYLRRKQQLFRAGLTLLFIIFVLVVLVYLIAELV